MPFVREFALICVKRLFSLRMMMVELTKLCKANVLRVVRGLINRSVGTCVQAGNLVLTTGLKT